MMTGEQNIIISQKWGIDGGCYYVLLFFVNFFLRGNVQVKFQETSIYEVFGIVVSLLHTQTYKLYHFIPYVDTLLLSSTKAIVYYGGKI